MGKEGWRNRITGNGMLRAADFLANEGNWRIHPKQQQSALSGALAELGWIQQVIVNQRTDPAWGRDQNVETLVDGHLRVSLALSEGDNTPVPVVYVDLSPQDEKLAMATIDPLAAMAVADKEQLDALLQEVQTGDAALMEMLADLAKQSGLDYGNAESGEAPEAQIDRAAELQALWKTQLGQLWVIPSKSVPGREHRLLCGDCRNPQDLARLCIERVQGVFTSPPYAEQRKEQYGGVQIEEYVDWWEVVQANVREVLLPDGSFFVNIKPHCDGGERVLYVMDMVLAMKRRWDWRFVDEFCWRDTRDGVPGGWQNRFKDAWEPVYQFTVNGALKFRPQNVMHPSTAVFEYSKDNSKAKSGLLGSQKAFGYKAGNARPSNVVECPAESAGLGHDAPFPVPLAQFFVRAYSDSGDIWLDTFAGSGTVIVAAEENGRLGYGIELLPKHTAVILQRLADMGLSPKLVEDS